MELVFLIGRIILGVYFVFSGVNHFMQYGMMSQYTGSKGIPAPGVAVVVTGLMLLLGGLSILLGLYTVVGAWLLIVFLVPVAFLMHNFWAESDPMAKGNQMAHFLKNIALAGALLIISTVPSWPFSLSL
jgi:uncharacterized membrane protein YphA (DoxX/SURF4 family)